MLFLVLMVVVGGCRVSSRSVPLLEGWIDHFEDGNPINLLGNPWVALAEGSGTSSRLFIVEGGYGTSRFYLHVKAHRPLQAQGTQVAGVRTWITEQPPTADPVRKPLPRDVSAFKGVAFAMRGTPGTYIVQLGVERVKDYDQFNAYLTLTDHWTEFRIPFSKFKQEGFGKPVIWTGKDLQYIAFYGNVSGAFEFGLDDVRFYK